MLRFLLMVARLVGFTVHGIKYAMAKRKKQHHKPIDPYKALKTMKCPKCKECYGDPQYFQKGICFDCYTVVRLVARFNKAEKYEYCKALYEIGWTQQMLAEEFNTNQSTIGRWINGIPKSNKGFKQRNRNFA